MHHFDFPKAPAAPARLHGKIMAEIGRNRERLALRKTLFSSAFLTISVFAIGWGLTLASATMADSGFGQYLTLLFTDFSAVMSSLGAWSSSLLESAPALSLALLLVGIAGALESLRSLLQNHRFPHFAHRLTF